MANSTSEQVGLKKFFMLADLKEIASKKAKLILNDNKTLLKDKTGKHEKFLKKLANELAKGAKQGFAHKFIPADSTLKRAAVLTVTITDIFAAIEINEELESEYTQFMNECVEEYKAQASYFLDNQVSFIDNPDFDSIFDATKLLSESEQGLSNETLQELEEYINIGIQLHKKLKTSYKEYSTAALNNWKSDFLSYSNESRPIAIVKLRAIVTEIFKAYYLNLTSSIEKEILTEKSLDSGSAKKLVKLMLIYSLLEKDFLGIFEQKKIGRYSKQALSLKENLDNISATVEEIDDQYLNTLQSTDPKNLIHTANELMQAIKKLFNEYEFRYQEFKSYGEHLFERQKSLKKIVEDTTKKILDFSLKIPVDYKPLQPEIQFEHWQERIEKIDRLIEEFRKVGSAVRALSKARIKLILSGESYAVDLCRRYPKTTSPLQHHLEQYRIVIEGVGKLSGTERVVSELETQARELTKIYQDFKTNVERAISILAALNDNTFKLTKRNKSDLWNTLRFFNENQGSEILVYPDLEKLWVPAFREFEKAKTKIYDLLEVE